MPNSCRAIIHRMLHKGAMTQEEHDKIIRKLDSSERKGANRMNLINRQNLQSKIDCIDRLEINVDGQKIEVIPRWNVNAIIESMPSASPHFESVIDLLEKRVEYLRPKACTLGDYWTGAYEAYEQMLKDINEAIRKDEEHAKVRGEKE